MTHNRSTLRLIVGIRFTNPASLRKDRNVCKEIPTWKRVLPEGNNRSWYCSYLCSAILPELSLVILPQHCSSSFGRREAEAKSSWGWPAAQWQLHSSCASHGSPVSLPAPFLFCELQFKSSSNRSSRTSLNVSSPTLTQLVNRIHHSFLQKHQWDPEFFRKSPVKSSPVWLAPKHQPCSSIANIPFDWTQAKMTHLPAEFYLFKRLNSVCSLDRESQDPPYLSKQHRMVSSHSENTRE